MTEHRPVLDPNILRRLASSMENIAAAWESDVTELRGTEARLADTIRTLNAVTDRANDVSGDLLSARAENKALLLRNAHLEAHVQALYDRSLDAQDLLGALASRAVDVARGAPAAEPGGEKPAPVAAPPPAATRISVAPDQEPDDFGDDDGTNLPRQRPKFLQAMAAEQPRRTIPPQNSFGTPQAMAAE
jgi:hypothetical protein